MKGSHLFDFCLLPPSSSLSLRVREGGRSRKLGVQICRYRFLFGTTMNLLTTKIALDRHKFVVFTGLSIS